MSSSVEWVAVDWGTSNLRAWGIGPDGQVQFARSSDQGMGRLVSEAYPGVLTGLLAGEIEGRPGPIEVLICGMAGARQGWMEAPYIDAPADLGSLVYGAVTPPMPDSPLRPRILPGVCQKLAGSEDVIRGEETQILGLASLVAGFAGTVIMPGTHSKWVAIERNRLIRFATAMSGEIYETLRLHSVLRHSLNGPLEGPEREEGFLAGAEAGLDAPQELTSLLFKVRAASLLSGRGPAWCAGHLSGLLIGAEIGGHRHWLDGDEVILIGTPRLCELYASVLSLAGATSRTVDSSEAVLAGLKAARQAGQQ